MLIRLFINPETQSYLRQLSDEFGLSTNSVREELNQLSRIHLLKSEKKGRRILYQANQEHPLFPELQSMVAKAMGIDQVVEGIIKRLVNIEKAYLIDDYAIGKDTGIIDIVLVGQIDSNQLNNLSKKTEQRINRKIRSLILAPNEYEDFKEELEKRPRMLLSEPDFSVSGVNV